MFENMNVLRRIECLFEEILRELHLLRRHHRPNKPTLHAEISMTQAIVTITLPSTFSDGSSFTPANYGGATVFKAGTQIGQITAPTLTFTDTTVTDKTPGDYVYTAMIHDTNGDASPMSDPVTLTVAVAPVLTPSAPTIAVALG